MLFTQGLPLRSPSFWVPNDGPFQLSRQENTDMTRKRYDRIQNVLSLPLNWRGSACRSGSMPILGRPPEAHQTLEACVTSVWWPSMGDHSLDAEAEDQPRGPQNQTPDPWSICLKNNRGNRAMTCYLPRKQPWLSTDSTYIFMGFKKQTRLWRQGQSAGYFYGIELNGQKTRPLLPTRHVQPNSSELPWNPPHWYIPFHTLTSVFNIYWKPLKRRSSSCVRERFESLAVGCFLYFTQLYYKSFHYCIF